MQIIYKARGQGKTMEAIKHSAKTGACIVCCDQHLARYTVNMAKDLNLKIPYPMIFDDLINNRYHIKGVKSIIIDNADMLLQQFTRVPIDMITLTQENFT